MCLLLMLTPPARSEKKLLNEINHSKDAEQLRYHVMASKDGNGKVKERISLPVEKLFILVSCCGQTRSAVKGCQVSQDQHEPWAAFLIHGP